jgi:U3 small nucleolar RNA-associated protein 12
VTCLGFIKRPDSDEEFLVSGSKDTLLKVWDLTSHTCLQSIVGHRCEVWSLAVIKSHDSEIDMKTSYRVLTGSSDDLIRGYRIKLQTDLEQVDPGSVDDILEYYGSVKRGSGDRCSSLTLSSSGKLLAAQSTGKVVEVIKFYA